MNDCSAAEAWVVVALYALAAILLLFLYVIFRERE